MGRGMQITAITVQAKNKNRVNVMVDGVYRFSLDIAQLAELGLKKHIDYTEEQLVALEDESVFGKVYTRALEYTFSRPHSAKEIRDYLWKKTRDTKTKTGTVRRGVSPQITERVFERLTEKGHVNDESFTRFWVENRHLRRGASHKKLTAELMAKGVDRSIIEKALSSSTRDDTSELMKVIEKRRPRYADENKLVAYLIRQGFSYDDVKRALQSEDESIYD